MIFRCGITGSGRKATCRNGSGRVTPSAFAPRRRSGCSASRDRLEGRSLIRPAIGSASSARTAPSDDDDEAALERDEAVDRRRHVGVVGADDADVVAVMADRGGDGAALQAEAVDEAAADIAVDAVPRDDRDLDDVLGEVDASRAAARRAGRVAGAR